MDDMYNTMEWLVELGPYSRIMPYSTRPIKKLRKISKNIPGYFHLPSRDLLLLQKSIVPAAECAITIKLQMPY